MLGFDRLDDPIAFVAGNDCDIPEDIQHLLLSTRRALLLLDNYSQRAARQEMHVRFRQDAMDDLFRGTPVERLRLDPVAHGLTRVGHHGFFRDASRPLWESVLLPRLAMMPDDARADDVRPVPIPSAPAAAPMAPVG